MVTAPAHVAIDALHRRFPDVYICSARSGWVDLHQLEHMRNVEHDLERLNLERLDFERLRK